MVNNILTVDDVLQIHMRQFEHEDRSMPAELTPEQQKKFAAALDWINGGPLPTEDADEPEDNTFVIYEEEYLLDPDRYHVHYVGFDPDGTPWAMVHINE